MLRGDRKPDVRFAGYAAVFNQLDNGADIVRPGAFARSLSEGRTIPLLWQHRTGVVIGQIEALAEDDRGLRVIGRIAGGSSGGTVARLIGSRRLNGLSFGYRVREASRIRGARELTDLDLVEVSVVSKPMQPRALIHAVQPA